VLLPPVSSFASGAALGVFSSMAVPSQSPPRLCSCASVLTNNLRGGPSDIPILHRLLALPSLAHLSPIFPKPSYPHTSRTPRDRNSKVKTAIFSQDRGRRKRAEEKREVEVELSFTYDQVRRSTNIMYFEVIHLLLVTRS